MFGLARVRQQGRIPNGNYIVRSRVCWRLGLDSLSKSPARSEGSRMGANATEDPRDRGIRGGVEQLVLLLIDKSPSSQVSVARDRRFDQPR